MYSLSLKSVVHVSLVKNNNFFYLKRKSSFVSWLTFPILNIKEIGMEAKSDRWGQLWKCNKRRKGSKSWYLFCAHTHTLPGILKGNQGVSATFEPHRAGIHQKRWKRWILICWRHVHKTKGLVEELKCKYLSTFKIRTMYYIIPYNILVYKYITQRDFYKYTK